ncbi:MAG TPA: ankyrin repeat domain-containing protein [Ktedonobacteraceae bacterium]|nr:ankyrin repeat domain-containing protein [Ktedonobacteraceae bacterium]
MSEHPSQELVEPFVIAAHFNLPRVKELYGRYPELLNEKWAKFDESALAAASHTGQRAIAEFLLEQGAPMVICAAAMLGRTEDVAVFLRDDASLANARGAHGISILFHAAMSGNIDVTELLLAHGGGEGINDALHGAVVYNHIAMAQWLLAHGVTDVNTPNYEAKTPLKVANERGFSDMADVLRAHGGVE